MKVISIWQPFASLIVEGCKVFETRGWPAPASAIGTRIGIASTKSLLPAQRSHCADEEFQRYFEATGLGEWTELPFGYLLGTVEIDSVELMTEELMEDVSAEEQSYGWWEPGNFAWRLRKPMKLPQPIPIRGRQGLFEWNGELPDVSSGKFSSPQEEGGASGARRPEQPADIRRHLQVI